MAPVPRLFLRSRVTPFVILFIERDGSTYLTSLLGSHPEVRAVYERFAVMRQKGESAEAQLTWARGYLKPPLLGLAGAVGFKTKLVDVLDPDGFAVVLREAGCRILQMQRRNHIKAVVSRINARRLHEASGNWNLYRAEDRRPPLTVVPEEFDGYLRERKDAESQLQAYVTRLDLPTLALVYEDLLSARESTLRRVFDFLGIRRMPLAGRTLKHTSDNLREAILNFDELRSRYVGTNYEPMFDEVIAPAA